MSKKPKHWPGRSHEVRRLLHLGEYVLRTQSPFTLALTAHEYGLMMAEGSLGYEEGRKLSAAIQPVVSLLSREQILQFRASMTAIKKGNQYE